MPTLNELLFQIKNDMIKEVGVALGKAHIDDLDSVEKFARIFHLDKMLTKVIKDQDVDGLRVFYEILVKRLESYITEAKDTFDGSYDELVKLRSTVKNKQKQMLIEWNKFKTDFFKEFTDIKTR